MNPGASAQRRSRAALTSPPLRRPGPTACSHAHRCVEGYRGEGRRRGSRCSQSEVLLTVTVSVTVGVLSLLVVVVVWIPVGVTTVQAR